MKNLLLIFIAIFSLGALAQDWQYIGGQGTLGGATEIALAKGTNNQIYIAKKNGSNISVHTWSGTNWTQVGSTHSTAGTNLQLGIKPGGIPVIAYYDGSAIRIYSFEGGGWLGQVPGATPLTSPSNREFKMFVENGGDIRMTYFNQNFAIYNDERTICTYVSPLGVSVVGGATGEIDQDDAPHWKNTDFIFDQNDENWVLYDYDGLGEGLELVHRNGGFWNYHNVSAETAEDAKFVEVGSYISSYYRETGTPTVRLKLFNKGTSSFTASQIIGNSDQDFAVSKVTPSSSMVFYRSNSSSYSVKEHSTSGTIIKTWSNFGPAGAISDLNLTSYSNSPTNTYFPIVAFISGGNVSVMETSMSSTINYTSESFCVGNSITTGDIEFNDPNYDNSLSVVQINFPFESPLSNASYSGSFPNMQVTFDVDMSSSMEGPHNFTVNYNNNITTASGFSVDVETFSLTLLNAPEINFSFATNEFCTNSGPINLNNFSSPSGGVWSNSGTVLNNGILNPAAMSPGSYTLEYTVTNSNNSCSDTENFDIEINGAATLSTTTTASSCGNENGTAVTTVTTNPTSEGYEIYWSNGDITDLADTLAPGMYYVNVTTDSGCVTMSPVAIENTDINLSGTTTDAVCFGEASGSIDLSISGAGAPFSIAWSNGSNSEDQMNLLPGPYDVTVTNQDGCSASQTFIVSSPDEITWTAGNEAPTCGSSNGLAFCQTIGGTAPYTWQWFNSSGTAIGTNNDTLQNINGGFYNVVITDDQGCSATWSTAINEVGGPQVEIDSVYVAGCANEGAVYTTLNAPAGIQEIGWNSGQTTEDISGLAPGYYAIWVIDNNGCTGMASANVNAVLPSPVDVCLVTVDENTTTNKVVWEKPLSTTIANFNIYRETSQAGLFNLVGTVGYDDESEFTDPVASPQVRSWRYKIASEDICGQESSLSEDHKTIHLTISLGLGSNINLHWDHYEGFEYVTYEVRRFDATNGWTTLTNLPSSATSYTDMPVETDGLDYMVVVTPPATCSSTKANDYNSSRSNRSAGIFDPNAAGVQENTLENLELYPNPSQGQFKLIFEESGKKEVTIVSTNGKVIYTNMTSKNQIDFDLTNVEAGVYHLVIKSDKQNVMRKLVIK